MAQHMVTIDGNEAAVAIAYQLSDIIAIYPITPSTSMGEQADAWMGQGQPNLWGTVPEVIEMQSEGGAAGALHGALQTGALATTFTASQGLMLMLPNMYKIAGELTPAVFHVAARALAAQGLSIFGDHSDVMATRATGWALLGGHSVQAAHDLALIAHATTLQARVPFLHFFDGFRTSHEINKIAPVDSSVIRALIDDTLVQAHRARALSPENPVIRGTAQNPDVYFQARESANPYYQACPALVQQTMDRFASLTGRQYHLFDYTGAADAERVIIVMGSGAETASATASYLQAQGGKVGVINVHLFRPFSVADFIAAIPATVRSIAVLDRCKEPGSIGEPLYQDTVTALAEAMRSGQTPFRVAPHVIGGRFGLSSKEFTPAMVKAIFDELAKPEPKNHFTIGINDDVTYTSLDYDARFSIEDPHSVRCIFWGLGSDGTVGANKNAIKIIGEETANHAQGYFVYDSKKSGSVTISHLRFGPNPIQSPYLIYEASFVACHQFGFLERYDMLSAAVPGGIFLLNSPYGPAEVWDQLPQEVQAAIVDKDLHFYVIDAQTVAQQTGLTRRVNTIMQTCFFAISGVMPADEAMAAIKHSIEKSYGKRGAAVVQQNFAAIDSTLANLHEVSVPLSIMHATNRQAVGGAGAGVTNGNGAASLDPTFIPLSAIQRREPVAAGAPDFVRTVLGPMIAGTGDSIPVSALPNDGTYPTATSQWEKRNIALEMPVWDPDICIQCGKCAFVCPHAVIRMKVVEPSALADQPESFLTAPPRFKEFPDLVYTLQISPDDCTGCGLCVEACPAKDKRQVSHKAINMVPQPPIRDREAAHWDYFMGLPDLPHSAINRSAIKSSQLLRPLFEFSGACAGCGETPYIKLMSQLFGDRAIVANATGCSSIYGGNLPTTPWACNSTGQGPAWANSLFEDNAEFGLGMRLTLDKHAEYASELLPHFADQLGPDLVADLLGADQSNELGIGEQRERVQLLKQLLKASADPRAHELISIADALCRRSVWLIGGDGWAYDIGYGGLDHVLASGRNVNILVLDTEVYSNTGGQASKSTPRAAVAKFAANGKRTPKKDLALLAMAYGSVYVARIAMGANDQQTLTTFLEAEAYDGPSLIIAYSPCIAHGYDLRFGLQQQKLAVQSGHWPLFRFNPDLAEAGQNPLVMDSKPPSVPLEQYAYNETRYQMLRQSDPVLAETLMRQAKADVARRWKLYEQMALIYAPAEPHSVG
ncbi:MAG: pyruvate:ferredoxin (flavodoxin) oxidoreductase [Herpetosiphonaceae bacterium]|nr:pyruvate:ferredoxin (flavodoxin) oxidoreductase [Herpetosiphonaceae bacterium]